MDFEKLKEPMATPKEVREYIYKHADHGGSSFCKWLQWWHNKLIIRTFAYTYKRRGADRVLYTEVERCVIGSDQAIRKNLYKTCMGGYHAVFKNGQQSCTNYYGYTYYYFSPDDFDVWYLEPIAGMWSPVINVDYIFTLKKYKYCGYSGKQDLKEYLEYYEKDPSVEFFGKIGLRYSKMLGSRAKKDGAFRKFITKNINNVNLYGYKTTVYAFDNNVSFKEANDYMCEKMEAQRAFSGCRKINYKVDKLKVYRWFYGRSDTKGECDRVYKDGKRTYGWRSYKDYWNACVELGLDMRDTKNSMPRDFKRMHDARIEEYAALQIARNKQKRAERDKKFEEKMRSWNISFEDERFTVRLPQKVSDLETEGLVLHHCVGHMGYDQKVIEGKVIIAFIRLKKDPDKPLYTVEYDLKQKTVLQMHGDHNSEPDRKGKAFIKKWAEVMKENVKKATG